MVSSRQPGGQTPLFGSGAPHEVLFAAHDNCNANPEGELASRTMAAGPGHKPAVSAKSSIWRTSALASAGCNATGMMVNVTVSFCQLSQLNPSAEKFRSK